MSSILRLILFLWLQLPHLDFWCLHVTRAYVKPSSSASSMVRCGRKDFARRRSSSSWFEVTGIRSEWVFFCFSIQVVFFSIKACISRSDTLFEARTTISPVGWTRRLIRRSRATRIIVTVFDKFNSFNLYNSLCILYFIFPTDLHTFCTRGWFSSSHRVFWSFFTVFQSSSLLTGSHSKYHSTL